jgi:ISXO2-like transposase domain
MLEPAGVAGPPKSQPAPSYEDGRAIHSNTVENVFSVFKRGMHGVHHCREKHLHRYLAEFDFRYNRRTAVGYNDAMRVADIVKGAEGKAPHLSAD